MTLLIDEAIIHANTSGESFERGQYYASIGAVRSLVLRGNQLAAAVQGSSYEPYHVQVTIEGATISAADCTCPYDWGGWCKHIVATLLVASQQPHMLEERPPLADALTRLDQAQLQRLVTALATRRPEIIDDLEVELALLGVQPVATPGSPAAAPAVIDTQPIRRKLRAIIDRATRGDGDDYDYYNDDDPISSELNEVVHQARPLLQAGDWPNALDVLAAILEELVDSWDDIYEITGSATDLLHALGHSLSEALLLADLTPDERSDWVELLAGCAEELEPDGEGSLAMAHTAALQGWAYPPLLRVLKGEISDQGAWEGEAPAYADDLARIRLAILERQGRLQEYLYLAEAEGQTDLYLLMLAKSGQVATALAAAPDMLEDSATALALGRVLLARGEQAGALQVAERGLALKGDRHALADWLVTQAQATGQAALALRAAVVGFNAQPSLERYQQIRQLAGDKAWPAQRKQLLKELHRLSSRWRFESAGVDIFLAEGLLDDAIAVMANDAAPELLMRVVAAAIPARPDWAIRTAKRQAERIMDAARADLYQQAANWLRHGRDAYLAAGRSAQWQGYLAELRQKHGRKYKLMGLIERL